MHEKTVRKYRDEFERLLVGHGVVVAVQAEPVRTRAELATHLQAKAAEADGYVIVDGTATATYRPGGGFEAQRPAWSGKHRDHVVKALADPDGRPVWFEANPNGEGSGTSWSTSGKPRTARDSRSGMAASRRRRDAESALAELVQSLEKQTYIAPQRITLADFVRTEWLPTMQTQVKISTWDSYRRNLQNHVLPALGGTQLQQLTTGHLNSLYRSLLGQGRRNGAGGLSPKTVRNIHGTMSKLLTDAADRGLVSRNIATSARPPKPRKTGLKEIRFWTPAELSEFLSVVHDDRLYALWHLAAMTGMRRGELLGLRWEDIDEKAKRISVRQTVISVAYEVTVSTPKSHNARVIDVDPRSIEVLRQHRRSQDGEREAAGAAYAKNNRVFRKADGTIIHPDVMRTMFDYRVKRSGVRRIRFHDLRHTHATIGLRAGVPVKVMSERLGHSTPAFTLQQYAHVIPGMQAEAAEAIADLVAGVGRVDSAPEEEDDDEFEGADDHDE